MSRPLDERVRDVLLRDWDPAGARGTPAAATRYDCQVQDLTLLLLGDATADDLAAYLRTAETERFGQSQADEPRLARTVEALRAEAPLP